MRPIPFRTTLLALLLATLRCQDDDNGSAPESTSDDDSLPDDDDTEGDDTVDDDDTGTTNEELPQLEIICTGREGDAPTGEAPVDLQCVLDNMPEVAADPACNDPLASPCPRQLECVSEVAPATMTEWLYRYAPILSYEASAWHTCHCNPNATEEDCIFYNRDLLEMRALLGCPYLPSACDERVYDAFRAEVWCEYRSMMACIEQAVGGSPRPDSPPPCEETTDARASVFTVAQPLVFADPMLMNCINHDMVYGAYFGWSSDLLDKMDAYIDEYGLGPCYYMGRYPAIQWCE